MTLWATPFHARTSDANRHNAWLARNGVALAARYDSVEQEALAARLNVVVADISWRWRAMFEGASAEAFLSKLMTRDAAALAPGGAFKALWLSDAGGVRGAGVIARRGRETFQLTASAPDRDWIASAVATRNVPVRDISRDAGGLAVIGPYAAATLKAAGLEAELEPLAFRKLSWRGIEVTLSRWGEHGGTEIWCAPDDGVLVWDRLMRAGAAYGIVPAGVAAMDVLDLEAGVPRPGLDYKPAREASDAEPMPAALGLLSLIDEAHHGFNGRRALLAGRPSRKLVGLELDSDAPAPFTPVLLNEKPVGHTLRSAYSPALKRAIALATVDEAAAVAATLLSLTLPPAMAKPELHKAVARVASLPFLEKPASIDA
ncbi:MAG TPA: glycine cleavage T C-terminal barrel domain-containing protein [Rhizomicrobium sp.]|nr:glycine cleavage T C-terminal barrel domain-containing protein [Rhizomicrobium sp.]